MRGRPGFHVARRERVMPWVTYRVIRYRRHRSRTWPLALGLAASAAAFLLGLALVAR